MSQRPMPPFRTSPGGILETYTLLAILGGAAALLAWGADDVAGKAVPWGLALVLGGVAVAFYRGSGFDMFAPRFLVGMTFSLLYGVGTLRPFFERQTGSYTSEVSSLLAYYPEAARVAFLCLAGFLVGYENPWIAHLGARSSLLRWRQSESSMKYLWLVMAVAGFGAIAVSIRSNAYFQTTTEIQSPTFYGIVGLFLNCVYVATVLSVGMAFESRSRAWRILAIGTTTVLAFVAIPTGSKTMFFVAFVFLAITWNYMRGPFSRREALVAFAGGIAVLILMLPFNIAYRAALMDASTNEQSLGIGISKIGTALEDVAEMDRETLLDLVADYSGGRLQNVAVVATILKYLDEGGELQYGATYARMFLVVIPRLLWPDKPPITLGQTINRQIFGGDEKNVTSVGITMVGEQVYNFPSVLAPIGMIFIGLFFRWLYEVFRSGFGVNPVLATAVYAGWWYTGVFGSNETNWASCFNGMVVFTVLLFVVFGILGMKRVRGTEVGPDLGRA